MGKSAKIARLRKDKYYQLAKEHGYRSRAAFKLIQLNRKFGFLNDSSIVIDLCAAPGGWLQVVSNVLPISSIIIGVDLFPIKPIKNTITLVNDITTPECFKNIKEHLNNQLVDCVLHDGAPNLGQAWETDAFGQAQLTLHSIRMASKFLKFGGWFVTKIFRSRDYTKLIGLLKKLFQHVHSTKPLASRKESAEIFVVCQGYLGLKNIDTSILDFKNVFKEQDDTNESTKTLTLKAMFKEIKKAKPNRDGYDTDSQLLHSTLKLSEFLSIDTNILNILSKVNRIDIDDKTYDSKDITPDFIKDYFKDLKVLGYQEFKQLLDWRRDIRLKFELGKNESTNELNPEKIPLTEEQKIENEIEIAELNQTREEKRLKKKEMLKQRLLKTSIKINQKMEAEKNIDIDNTGLFSVFFNNNNNQDSSILFEDDMQNNINKGEIYENEDNDLNGILLDNRDYINLEMSDKEDEFGTLESQLDVQMEFLRNAGLNRKKQKYDKMSNTLNKQGNNFENIESNFIDEPIELTDGDDDEQLDMEFLREQTNSIPITNNEKSVSLIQNEGISQSKQNISNKDIDDNLTGESDDESSCSISDNDNNEKITKNLTPEMLALATRMKRSKKEKENIINSLWNRNCRGEENTPQWFIDDEAKATHRILPITKQDMEQYKQEQRILQSQPRKKVLEARQRKKNKIVKLIEKARTKSEKLTSLEDDQNDIALNQDKIDTVKRIYKKVSKELNRKKSKSYVVAKRHLVSGRRYSKPKSVVGPYKVVDPRQKKDKLHNKTMAGKKKQKKFSKHKRR